MNRQRKQPATKSANSAQDRPQPIFYADEIVSSEYNESIAKIQFGLAGFGVSNSAFQVVVPIKALFDFVKTVQDTMAQGEKKASLLQKIDAFKEEHLS